MSKETKKHTIQPPSWLDIFRWMRNDIIKFNDENIENFIVPAMEIASLVQKAQWNKAKFCVFYFGEDGKSEFITSNAFKNPEAICDEIMSMDIPEITYETK